MMTEVRVLGTIREIPAAKGVLKLEGGLLVDVYVLGERGRYGGIDYKITPMAGEGAKWVSSNKVELV